MRNWLGAIGRAFAVAFGSREAPTESREEWLARNPTPPPKPPPGPDPPQLVDKFSFAPVRKKKRQD